MYRVFSYYPHMISLIPHLTPEAHVTPLLSPASRQHGVGGAGYRCGMVGCHLIYVYIYIYACRT